MNPMPTGRPAFLMPVRRRGTGLTQNDIFEEKQIWTAITTLIGLLTAQGAQLNVQKTIVLIIILLLLAYKIRAIVWNAVDPVNTANKNRMFTSWTNEESFRELGFRLDDLPVSCYILHSLPHLYII